NCLRTFIDIKMTSGPAEAGHDHGQEHARGGPAPAEVKSAPVKFLSKVPKAEDEQRLIIATCEKGTVEDVDAMRGIKAGLDAVKKANPNFVEIAAKEVWNTRKHERVADPIPSRAWTRSARRRKQ